jgi:hypothetical protein
MERQVAPQSASARQAARSPKAIAWERLSYCKGSLVRPIRRVPARQAMRFAQPSRRYFTLAADKTARFVQFDREIASGSDIASIRSSGGPCG